MFVPIWLIVLTLSVIVILILVVWSVKRRRQPDLKIDPMPDVEVLMRTVAGVTQGTVVDGNAVSIVQNGDYFDVLFRDIDEARSTIDIETFLAKRGEITRRLAELLAHKARQGVNVRLMLDASGGRRFGVESIQQMIDAGCRVVKYHPYIVSNIGRFNNRTHRKIIVLDGKIAYIGGHCFTDDWLGKAEDKKHFRDLSVRVEGPVVAQFQGAFTDNWIEETGEVLGGNTYFPQLERRGNVPAQVVHVSPAGNPSTVKVLHYLAVASATRSITMQNPYFLPDPEIRAVFVDAIRRGVEVRVMLPSAEASDLPVVQHASHHHYGSLLEAGIRIFEYQRTLLHQKVLTVDRCWAIIASANFDDRSFEINDEVALVVYDERLAQQLEQIFEDDLKDCEERRVDDWKRRSLVHRLKDGAAFLFNEQL